MFLCPHPHQVPSPVVKKSCFCKIEKFQLKRAIRVCVHMGVFGMCVFVDGGESEENKCRKRPYFAYYEPNIMTGFINQPPCLRQLAWMTQKGLFLPSVSLEGLFWTHQPRTLSLSLSLSLFLLRYIRLPWTWWVEKEEKITLTRATGAE